MKHMAMFDLGQPLSIPLAGCPSVSTGLLHIPLIYLCQAEFGVVIVIKKQICKNDHEKKSNSVQQEFVYLASYVKSEKPS